MRRLILALGVLLAVTACSRSAEPNRADVLHIGSQRGGTKAVMIASGALEGAPYTVEWSEFAAAQPLLEAIGAGAVDLGLAGDAPFTFAYQSGSPIKAVGAQFVTERPAGALALVVPGNSPAHSLADLKGKKIATTRGSVGHHLVIRALRQAKLPPDWVIFTFLAPGDAKAAFSSGTIDGWAIWTPYLAPALKEGARTIVDGRGLINAYSFDVANEKAIAAKRALLADFLRREARALAWARANPDAYAAALAKETGLPPDVARDYAAKNARSAVPIDDAVIGDVRQVLDDFRASGAVRGDRALADGFERDFTTTKSAAPSGPTTG
ncbi:aliphatic sulfonate ABC transporter substrate-binding protein [Sphingomonas oleivorans]|uniref:Putative aliphatic sulfonates-binding protein n=1 Tax=Sphingomonas oleivorans TaxID=1735121 RepID=A0A2T5G0S8_9SPHN|nr:ABC transporter substrate-binding protein [Sphingomonas oleivorans]PTQ12748.1 aliphatic sulfonate ABC transporter substrate-binding protein [Sphingomonas oleivorans]